MEPFEARIVTRGLISEAELAEAHRIAKSKERSLSETLIALGMMTEDQVGMLIAEELGVQYVFPQASAIDRDLLAELPRDLLVRHRVVPFLRGEDGVVFVSGGPLSEQAARELESACRCPVSYALSSPRRIDTLLGAPAASEDPGGVATFYGHLAKAMIAKATEIRFEPGTDGITVRLRVNGALEDRGREPIGQLLAISSKARALASTTRATRIGAREFDVHVGVLASKHGESVLVRLTPAVTPVIDDEVKEQMRSAMALEKGVVLLSAPSIRAAMVLGYAALRASTPEKRSIVTLEREPLEVETRFRQAELRGELGEAMRAALAYEPDVLLVGESIDKREDRERVFAAARKRVVMVPGAPEDWTAAVIIAVDGSAVRVVER